jgi:hypothetical protein
MLVTLGFHVVVSLPVIGTIHDGTSTFAATLSTGAESSPSGAFHDVGSPLQSNGAITLVADGTFTGDVLAGSDASLVLAGTISPHP